MAREGPPCRSPSNVQSRSGRRPAKARYRPSGAMGPSNFATWPSSWTSFSAIADALAQAVGFAANYPRVAPERDFIVGEHDEVDAWGCATTDRHPGGQYVPTSNPLRSGCPEHRRRLPMARRVHDEAARG